MCIDSRASETTDGKEDTPRQIFDRMFERLVRLSPGAVILFINALFETKYPVTASVEYLSTEHITDIGWGMSYF